MDYNIKPPVHPIPVIDKGAVVQNGNNQCCSKKHHKMSHSVHTRHTRIVPYTKATQKSDFCVSPNICCLGETRWAIANEKRTFRRYRPALIDDQEGQYVWRHSQYITTHGSSPYRKLFKNTVKIYVVEYLLPHCFVIHNISFSEPHLYFSLCFFGAF